MLGSDDLKSQDEKGSDGGEVSSSTTNDPDYHHHSCNEGSEEVEQRVPSAAQPSVADINSMKERKEGSVVKIERELKPEESSASNNVSLEYIEFAEESHYGSKKSGGTSNEESLSEKNSEAEPCKSIQGATTSEYLVKSADTAPAKITSITQNTQLKKADNSVVGSSVNSVKAVTSVSEENVRTSSLEVPNPKEFASKAPKSSSGIPFTESTNEEHNKDSRAPECSENQVLYFLMIASLINPLQKFS